MTYTNTAIKEIKKHINDINNDSIETAKVVLSPAQKFDNDKGLSSKSDYRKMYSAQRDEDFWNYTAQMFGCQGWQFTKDSSDIHKEDGSKPKAKIKKQFNKLHGSYVSDTKRNEKMIKEFIYRMKLEDVLDIKPIDNPFSVKDSTQMIKITGFEFRKPYIIISAINAEDEHDRLTQTRSLDETSEFFFIFDTTPTFAKNGMPIDNPELDILRKWIWKKVEHVDNKEDFEDMLNQIVGRIYSISTEAKLPVIDKRGRQVLDSYGKPIYRTNPEYIGFPTYDVSERIGDTFDKDSMAYEGAYCNIRYSKRSIDEMNGDIRYVKTSNSIDVYTGDKLLRSYHIVGTNED